jgi:hypothetical protein
LAILRCLWDLQSFLNFFICSAGSQVTGAIRVPPPSVHDYLYSRNSNLLIDIPGEAAEKEFNVENNY